MILFLATFVTLVSGRHAMQPVPIKYQSVRIEKINGGATFSCGGYQFYLTSKAPEGSQIYVKRNAKTIHRFSELGASMRGCPDSAYVADINADGLPDVKLFFNFEGASPLAAQVKRKIYLLSTSGQRFKKLSFLDFSTEPEMDFNRDRSYEIISKDLLTHEGHSYWKYEVFSISEGKLNNTSLKYGYPKFVRYLRNNNGKPVRVPKLQSQLSKAPREFVGEQ